jgi:metal-sulfur cluster biosynthetic enzyme
MTLDEASVLRLLDAVQDPCSVRMGNPLGLVGMGLVEAVNIDDDSIGIRLVLTGPGCFFYFQFAECITRALEPLAAGRAIDVTIDDTILWTKERMNVIPIRNAASPLRVEDSWKA